MDDLASARRISPLSSAGLLRLEGMAGLDDDRRAVMVLTSGDLEVVAGPVEREARCDLELVDHLLRLQLEAQRWGWTLHIREAGPDLRELFELVGLADRLD